MRDNDAICIYARLSRDFARARVVSRYLHVLHWEMKRTARKSALHWRSSSELLKYNLPSVLKNRYS